MPNKHKNKRALCQAARAVVLPSNDPRPTVAVIGGGASGIAAACALSACLHELQQEARVVILEKGRRLGSSVLRSGNGRCNFSHEAIVPDAFNRPELVGQVFAALEQAFAASPLKARSGRKVVYENAVLSWFSGLGLVWREAPFGGGALYPFSNKAVSVLEVLQAELDRWDVEQYCNVAVQGIVREGRGFRLEMEGQDESRERASLDASAVVFAAGGGNELLSAQAAKKPAGGAEALERIESIPFSPVLGPIKTQTDCLDGLDGVRAKARLSIAGKQFSEEGEVLFRAYGISGIVVFNASRFVKPGDTITLDFVPERSLERLEELLLERARFQAQRNGRVPCASELLGGFFLPELTRALVSVSAHDRASGLKEADPLDDADILALAHVIKAFPLVAEGIGDAKQCQVHRGGFTPASFDESTMEAFATPGLYLAGEAIDVDGPCGGYNLHWAWASGLLTGISIARRLCSGSELSSTGFSAGA